MTGTGRLPTLCGMPPPDDAPLRYLSRGDVDRLMPPIGARLALAERALVALAGEAQLPPKLGVHPRPPGSFAHAMPAFLANGSAEGPNDLLGLKWVTGFPNNRAAGLPQISGTVLLNDPATGIPRAILDAAEITAHRTAAVSGVCLRAWPVASAEPRVAILGAGVQARSHLPVLAHLLPGARIAIHDRHADRSEVLARLARESGAFANVRPVRTAEEALRGADVVLTMVSFGPNRQALDASALADANLIVAVDYDMSVPAETANGATFFVVDEPGQVRSARESGLFAGYREPDATIGTALQSAEERPTGTVLATHLGVGLADLIFADSILRRAEREGVGTELPR